MKKDYLPTTKGEPNGSPFDFLSCNKKWLVDDAKLIPQRIKDIEFKRNLAEIGKFIYSDLECQLKKSKIDPSAATESNPQNISERTDKAA